MAEQKLTEMPEYKRLSDYERKIIVCRVMKVYAAHHHPERDAEVAKVVEQIRKELKSGHRGTDRSRSGKVFPTPSVVSNGLGDNPLASM